MANPFDQFDATQQPAPRGNPFDQFDEVASAAPNPRLQFMPRAAAGQMEIKPESQDMDIAKSFGTGLVKGATGLLTLPQTMEQLGTSLHEQAGGSGIDPKGGVARAGRFIADMLPAGGLGLSPAIRMMVGGQPKVTNDKVISAIEQNVTPLHKPQTTAGKYAQTVGEFVPGGFTPGGVMRKAANVVLPGIASEAAGQIAEGSGYETPARIAGGIAGSMLPNVAMRAITPFPNPSPERARAVALMQHEGVPLTAGETTGRKSLRWAESAANDVPFSGQRIGAQKEIQAERFTQAAMRRAGIQGAVRATDDVIDDAFVRLGQQFDDYAQRVAIPVTPTLQQRIRNIVLRYEQTTEPSMLNPMPRNVLDDVAQAGTLTGRQYSRWRSDLGEVARGTQNTGTQRALYDIQREIDNAAAAMLRSTGRRDLADRMQVTRREYRNLLVLANARGAGEGPSMGLITPQQLQQAAKRMEGTVGYSRGRGDYTELAKAGVATMYPLPNSGTPARLAAQGIFTMPTAIAGTIAGTMAAGPGGGALAGLGAVLSQGTMARGLMSAPAQAYLRNQTLARAIQNNNARTPIAIGAQPITQPRDERR